MKKFLIAFIDTIFYKLKYRLYDAISIVAEERKQELKNRIINQIAIKTDDLKINGSIVITEPKMLCIGSNVHIGDNAYFNTGGGLIIGDNVHFSRNVTIYTTSHNYNGALPYNQQLILKSVTIKRNAWIGMNVNISPGVTIGEGAIVGIGATITKDVPDFAIVGNQPYRILKSRDHNEYNHMERDQVYGGVNGQLLPSAESNYVTGKELGEKLVFLVSTGRSGTASFASILSQHKNIICRHEITDILIKLSTDYEYGNISAQEAKKTLYGIYCNSKIFPKGTIYGESNQKLSNLIPLLHELLPKAKFVWVIRNGKKVVDSTYARGWYDSIYDTDQNLRDPQMMNWHNYRLKGDKVKDFTPAEWTNLSAFEKNCWYWVKWNTLIETYLKEVPEENQLFIKLEEVESKLIELRDFLNLEETFNFQIEIKNKAKNPLIGHQNWDKSQRKSFDRICGPLFSKYY